MHNNPFPIKQCHSLDLKFDDHGTAYSNNYADIYFQPEIGLDEKKHVFLKGNNLPKNWQDIKTFTIGETGFGIGLNFLNTIKLWNASKLPYQQLHYISCELHPLTQIQLTRALAQFPELKSYSDVLIKKYPQILMYGFHRLHFEEFNVSLTLIFGQALDAFEQCQAEVDAWFLDGFGPSKNPEMWSDELFKAIANISHIGTTAATFTVARKIRDGLTNAGFKINKVEGFGQKREMLAARLITEHKCIEKQPWYQTFKTSKCESITVLGAGIAGLTLAQKLQQQGNSVTLIDRQLQPCLETSGNPQAMVMPSFDLNDSPESRFYLTAFNYAIKYYSSKHYHSVGVHQLAFTVKQKLWQKKLLSKFDLPEQLVHQCDNGICYPQAGWLDTQAHAQSIFNQLDKYHQAEIIKIEYQDNMWRLYAKDGVVHTTHTLVLANGINLQKLLPDYEIPIIPKHGEISYFNSVDIASQIADCSHIQLCKGYITPSWNGVQTIGATFDHIDNNDWFKSPLTSDNHWQRNTELWQDTPYDKLLKNNISFKSRAGYRVTTPDHLPICGAVFNQQQFKQDYHDICHGKHWQQYPQPVPTKNLYIFTGLGSRGFTSAPLLAEFLSNQILGQAHALDKRMQRSIHPNRFLYKSLIHSNL